MSGSGKGKHTLWLKDDIWDFFKKQAKYEGRSISNLINYIGEQLRRGRKLK
jgi:hypothetical protein